VESVSERRVRATTIVIQPEAWRHDELTRMVDAGEISVKLERTFPLEKAPVALQESRTGHVRGKIVLLID
jgi:NADPH:quinone reductase-like Zn-dependent oxidoreductase